MGGGQKRGRTQRRHFRNGRENVWKKNADGNTGWETFATQNVAFEQYYKEQGIVREEEWDEFIGVLQKPLPAAFRINSSGQFYQDIRSQLENDFVSSLEATSEGEKEAIRPLPWYPENLAWHLNYSRMQLRKNQTLERFHEFLKQENEIGNITRQEAVSMVPPLFLDVRADHHILDMCAAPGSKTFQLLEMIHKVTEPGSLPDGLVIANDVDVQRCNLLIHQTKRMCSANLIVTNHEAQQFPSCHLSGSEEIRRDRLLFDRVLCDVPCSGDGTLRKAPDIWRKWNVGMGNGLHRLQVLIAMRGLALLKVGGRMVYSTCSMNPVENEAVVSEVLRRSGGSVGLLDVTAELPELIRRPGLKKWQVRDKGQWLTSYRDVPKHRKDGIFPSMFPSGQICAEVKPVSGLQENLGTCEAVSGVESLVSLKTRHQEGISFEQASINDNEETAIKVEEPAEKCACQVDSGITCKEEVSEFPLERCVRIVPHDQNTGAFFIAVFHKLAPLQEKQSDSGRTFANRKHNLSENLSGDITKDECSTGISTLQGSTGENLDLDEAVPDLTSPPGDSSIEQMEASLENEVSANKNVMEETDKCTAGENGAKGVKGGKGRLQIQGKWRGVDPVVFFRDELTINSIRTFYGISECFPLDDHLVTRNSDAQHVKRIYYVSDSVRDVLNLNFQVGQQLKITSLGLKIFERQTLRADSSSCAYRISSEGLPLLLPYISKQILSASLVDFEHLLKYKTIKFADFVDADFGEKASMLKLGCCVILLKQDHQPELVSGKVDASTIAVGCWRGKTNISVMVSQMDCQELLDRISARLGRERSTAPQIINNERCTAVADENIEDRVPEEDSEDDKPEAA
ncbi:hypothetical protein QJS10_CPB19g01409 [Acorus calamus]|uniref:SAM-dependent MTase RsmB/NOP-type domain-containing protein n=1 Tax=Acorus calamus TaxID=4465 RepID=A0AAV9CER4_ACOCL|nr:hypothetical protein QJS10_CPB19g01409 [Acorus calamus]